MMHTVRIEFRRIQGFLFQVPRLRDMVGANVLLGEALRVHLPELVLRVNGGRPSSSSPLPGPDALPDDCRLPSAQDDADPLNDADHEDRDDPWRQYQRGVLSRDGGHFVAAFPDEAAAMRFHGEAEALLRREVPGVRFDISIEPAGSRIDKAPKSGRSRRLMDLPQFQVCEESGRGPATQQREIGAPGESLRPWISSPVAARKQAGERFHRRGGKTRDVIGLLQARFNEYGRAPQDFQQLCAGGYLAVIHADGNDVGSRYRERMAGFEAPEGLAPDLGWLAKEAHGEHFFWSLRVRTRKALVEALGRTFLPQPDTATRHFEVLMLGGDDLLMVCRADAALRFVVNYASALRDLSAGDAPALTIGAGVVIARPNVPFHHLYELVETLTKSAKRRYRGLPDAQKMSVVDWMVSTTAWVDDPIAQRRRESLIHAEVGGAIETLALTRRPYRILADGAGPRLGSLEGLAEVATRLGTAVAQDRAARSQLRHLVDGLAVGRRGSGLLFDELPEGLRRELGGHGVTGPWESVDGGRWTTPLADLVELVEIDSLGRKRSTGTAAGGAGR